MDLRGYSTITRLSNTFCPVPTTNEQCIHTSFATETIQYVWVLLKSMNTGASQ